LLLKKGEGSGKRTYEYAKGRGRMFTRIERYCGAPTKGRGRDIQTLK
jgi:hypothetical protein